MLTNEKFGKSELNRIIYKSCNIIFVPSYMYFMYVWIAGCKIYCRNKNRIHNNSILFPSRSNKTRSDKKPSSPYIQLFQTIPNNITFWLRRRELFRLRFCFSYADCLQSDCQLSVNMHARWLWLSVNKLKLLSLFD